MQTIKLTEQNYNFWLKQKIQVLNTYQMMENKSFEFNGYYVALGLKGSQ